MATRSLVGVWCKLVQFVVYCVLFVMMSTNIEKKSEVSPTKSVVQSACQCDVTSRVSNFQKASKVFIEEMDTVLGIHL